MTDPLEGSCACGAVRYRLTAEPMFVHCCHCRDCQRQTGSAFVLNALIETHHIDLLAGNPAPVAVPTDSGQPHEIYRCPGCRTALWSDYGGRPALRFVRVGTLDRPAALAPDVHIFVRSKLPWIILPEGIPTFEVYYDAEKLWPAPASNAAEQSSKHEPDTWEAMMPSIDLPTDGLLDMGLFDFLGHLSYFLITISFLLRDILLLRIVATVAAGANLLFAAYALPEPNLIVVFWQALLILINVVWCLRLVYERRGLEFTEEERELYQSLFRAFSPLEFMKLMRIGQWKEAAEGHLLTRQGDPLEEIMLIYNGAVDVALPAGGVRRLKDGTFIGEMSFIRGGPATATVETVSPTRYLAWAKSDLRGLLRRNPAMASTMQSVFSEDLTKKLLTDIE